MGADRSSDKAARNSMSRTKSGSSWISVFRTKRSTRERLSNTQNKSPSREGTSQHASLSIPKSRRQHMIESFKDMEISSHAKEIDHSSVSLYSDLEDDASAELTDDDDDDDVDQEFTLKTLKDDSWGEPPRMQKQPSIPTIEWHPDSADETSSPIQNHVQHSVSNNELTSDGNMPLRRPSDEGSCRSARSQRSWGSLRSTRSSGEYRKRGFSKSAAEFVKRHSLSKSDSFVPLQNPSRNPLKHSMSNEELTGGNKPLRRSFRPPQASRSMSSQDRGKVRSSLSSYLAPKHSMSSKSERRRSDEGSCRSARSQRSRGSLRSTRSSGEYRKRGFSKSAAEFVQRHSLSTSDSGDVGRRNSLSTSERITETERGRLTSRYKNGLMAERGPGTPGRSSLSDYLESSGTARGNATEFLESPEAQNRKEKGYISGFLGSRDDPIAEDSPEEYRSSNSGSLLSRGLNALEKVYDNSLGDI